MTDLPAEQITLTNVEVTAGSRGRYKIYGEAVNNCATELSAILGVTFYDIHGEVIGRAAACSPDDGEQAAAGHEGMP